MKELIFTGPEVHGNLPLKESRLITIPAKEHYNTVDLCFQKKGTMHVPVAQISCSWLEYDEKVKLGDEMEVRWNGYRDLKEAINHSLSIRNEHERTRFLQLVAAEDHESLITQFDYTLRNNA